jgi:DNA-binding transcriptional LysR family regulator
MHGLDDIAVFVKVVQAGSFTQAARLLAMPITTVSAKVAHLEKRLGITLISRTTRKLSITQAGESYFRKCVLALKEIQAAEEEVTSNLKEPQGTLKITAPVDMGHILLPPIVQTLLKKFPKIKVDLVITNRVIDLVSEGIDIAVRAGELEDSSLICKKFVSSHMNFFASPQYLKKHGTPSNPKDLEKHQLIGFSEEMENGRTVNLQPKASFRVESRIVADDLETVKAFTLLGEGIGVFPRFICEEDIARGKLIMVLPKWWLGSSHFSLVYPAQKFVSPKIQAFIQVASEMTSKSLTLT